MSIEADRQLPRRRQRAIREGEEERRLSGAASRSAQSRGRLHSEPEDAYRTAFQRDRDRIVHSSAFRRLQYKTQVFVHHEGDHYRNRLTHSLEGAQITRSICTALGLNEDLGEAIALVHDLGHTPFGHAGERVLAIRMSGAGGFDHNRQCLRVVDLLETRHAEYSGLNLTDETREGILKHGCQWEHPVTLPELRSQRSLEAQVADACDEVAYLNHDLDDGLRAGLLHFEMLAGLPLLGDLRREIEERLPRASESVRRAELVRSMIDGLVTDLIEATSERLESLGLDSPEAVRENESGVVGFSESVENARLQLKDFLFERFYNHPSVLRATKRAESVVDNLFQTLSGKPELLPEGVRARFAVEGELRAIADYVAGMTDRFARAEHDRHRVAAVAVDS